MKTRIMLTIALCIAFNGCNRPNDCSEEAANNYGRPRRSPMLYNTEYMSLSELVSQYWQVVDGDTLRLEGYLVQTGNEDYGYHLKLCKHSPDSTVNSKAVRIYSDFYKSGGNELIISKRDGIPNTYGTSNIGSSTPFMDDVCNDTLKYKISKVEGIVHFTYHPSQVFCRDLCYLYVPNWEEQFRNIINQ